MAVSNINFRAQVDDWVKATEQRMVAVFRESTQRTVSIAQSLIPIDTGFARASVRASTESMPSINSAAQPVDGQTYGYDAGNITTTIAGAQLGSTIFVGWTASYAGILETGSSKQAPSGFVRLAALQWQVTVNQVVAEAKSRA